MMQSSLESVVFSSGEWCSQSLSGLGFRQRNEYRVVGVFGDMEQTRAAAVVAMLTTYAVPVVIM